MSIQAVAAVLELGPEVSGARRLVLISLANHANEDGECWPKRSTIAREAGIAKLATVTSALGWLEQHGYIERSVNQWRGSKGQIPVGKRPNLYRLRFWCRVDRDGSVSEPDGGGTPETGRGGTPETGTHGYPRNGYQNRHGESSREPSAPYSPPLPPEPPQLELVPSGGTQPQPDPFATWWHTYPSTKGKQAARKAWDRLTPTQRTQAGKALANYLTALDTHRHNGGTPPVMHASTFLNGRWIDWTADNTPDPAWPQPRRPARAAQQTDEAKELAHRIADQVRARRAAR